MKKENVLRHLMMAEYPGGVIPINRVNVKMEEDWRELVGACENKYLEKACAVVESCLGKTVEHKFTKVDSEHSNLSFFISFYEEEKIIQNGCLVKLLYNLK